MGKENLEIIRRLQYFYEEAHNDLAKYLQEDKPPLPKYLHNKSIDQKKIYLVGKYEKKLTIILRDILGIISEILSESHQIKAKKAVLQFNSLHKKVGSRVSIPWYAKYDQNNVTWKNAQREWEKGYYSIVNSTGARSKRDILFLQPDKPSHLLTEILWRFGNKWIGVLKEKTIAEKIKGGDIGYLCGISSTDEKKFEKAFGDQLNVWRIENIDNAEVDLGEDYNRNDYRHLTARAFEWLHGENLSVDNIFFAGDTIESEQLAGVAMELEIPETTNIDDINIFIKDCQWLLNQYIYNLVLNAEKTYSIIGTDILYRDAYFYDGINGKSKKYLMIQHLKLFFAVPDKDDPDNKLNMRFRKQYVNYDTVKILFKKIRTHLGLAEGSRGNFIRGYKHHAYEVACTVAGIMDILFKFGDNRKCGSLEEIIRKSEPNLSDIDSKLNQPEIPFLFRQLFKGLGKENQLFLIPQYREHFIHSFYVFVFGLIFMFYAPTNVIPKSIRTENKSQKEVLELLKKWFLVSMWHDIAYMVEKGNMVLEQHITSFLHSTERKQGLVPWHPSLGNLMQAKGCLEEIRELSENVISFCDIAFSALNSDQKNKLSCDVIVATAFERRDHGIWSALMLNHAWNDTMSDLFCKKNAEEIKKEIVKAIMPHHIANWDVKNILNDYTDLKNCFFKGCGKIEALERLCKENTDPSPEKLRCSNNKECIKPLAFISRKSNPFGFLLGLCDIVSQAGREAPELSKFASKLGIKYKSMECLNGEYTKGSLSITLKYKDDKTISSDKFINHFLIPALFLGLQSDKSSQKEALMIHVIHDEDKKNIHDQEYYLFDDNSDNVK